MQNYDEEDRNEIFEGKDKEFEEMADYFMDKVPYTELNTIQIPSDEEEKNKKK